MKFFATIALTAALLFLPGCKHKPFVAPVKPVTLEQKTTHEIVLLDDEGEGTGLCTATAIGPHALLTADHCNENDKDSAFTLDFSTHKYHIIAVAHDDRDHSIYLVDGPAFKNFVTVKVAPAVMGEKVHLYGDGGGHFPARELDGVVADRFDPSDVDETQGIGYYTMPVIGGDSGSAVYNEKNEIVGILTYGIKPDATGLSPVRAAGFALNFPQEAYDIASTYMPGTEG